MSPESANAGITVAPSILACDFAHLADEVRRAEDAGADEFHVDVMDGQFVRNITIGPLIVEAARRSTKLPLNVHLMIDTPEVYAKNFVDAGADCILVHPECKGDPAKALDIVRENGVRTGVALNPETPFEAAKGLLAGANVLLVMSVNPGWGGQAFMPEVLPKFAEAREWLSSEAAAGAKARPNVTFGIDGGINFDTARLALRAGADYLIAGTFLFGQADMRERIARLRKPAEEHRASLSP